jgi:hypothetical protein
MSVFEHRFEKARNLLLKGNYAFDKYTCLSTAVAECGRAPHIVGTRRKAVQAERRQPPLRRVE